LAQYVSVRKAPQTTVVGNLITVQRASAGAPVASAKGPIAAANKMPRRVIIDLRLHHWPSGIISLNSRTIGVCSSPSELPIVQSDNLQGRKFSRSLGVAPGDERSIAKMVDRLPVGEGTA